MISITIKYYKVRHIRLHYKEIIQSIRFDKKDLTEYYRFGKTETISEEDLFRSYEIIEEIIL